MRIRKQVYELTVADLHKWPAWEFCSDEEGEEGQDEATVRPIESAEPDNIMCDGPSVTAADFELADGTKLPGYITPTESGDLGLIQPTVVNDAGQLNFWLGAFPPGDLTAQYGLLGKTGEQVFPVRYKARIPSACGTAEGTLSGFGYINMQTSEVHEIK